MRAGAGNGAGRASPAPGPPDPSGGESLFAELAGAVEAAREHARKVAGTAAAEARLSAASLAALAATALAALAFLLIAWICLLALCVWLAVQAGAPVWAALVAAVLVNVAGVLACRYWVARLLPNLAFARTRRLLADPRRTWRSAG